MPTADDQTGAVWHLQAPVVFVIFNRPEHTARVFEEIRRQRPPVLFVLADGPREGRADDPTLCAQTRAVVEEIDWPCDVGRRYSDKNLGCYRNIATGLTWVFEQVEQAVILEDDCLPGDEFFAFCQRMLTKYEHDDRVMAITGDSFFDESLIAPYSYYFSKYALVWGWATWASAWSRFDPTVVDWPAWRRSPEWTALHPDPVERRYWNGVMAKQHSGRSRHWGYGWMVALWKHGGLCVTPGVNLVTNIGFGPDATHTRRPPGNAAQEIESLGELVNPPKVEQDQTTDAEVFDSRFSGAERRARRRPKGFAQWVRRGVRRRLRSLASAGGAE